MANGRHDAEGHVIASLAPQELAVTASGKLGDRKPSIEYWANKKPEGATPPYPFPPDRKYNTKGGPVAGKINVHLVPHTHDDTGWQVTVDRYFVTNVFYIIDTVIKELLNDVNRKFIYVETGFFARWWEEASDVKRDNARKVVANGQLEFINGGWCMHDEAAPLWTEMVDQTTRGHQFLQKNFGKTAIPRGTWQIDPFGHSQTQAWLLGAEAGMESLFWGRMDYQDRNTRKAKGQGFEWIWQGSKSLGNSAQVFAGDLYGTGDGGYSTWFDFDGEGNQVNDDPARHDYNVDQWVDKFVQDALEQANHTLTDHQMWACGTDFQYQNADHWYANLDKLVHYVNMNGTVNAFYSTPTLYVDEKKKSGTKFEVRTDDIFPLFDDKHNVWSGYFTSRPALKRQVRFATNLLTMARQLEVITNTTRAEVNLATERPSPPVGTSWTDSLEGTIGVATHHDGMSGTERQDVTDDYSQRISESSFEVEAGVAVSLSKLAKVGAAAISHCNCNTAGDCLNMTICPATAGKDHFSVIAWNPLAQNTTQIIRVPVTGAGWVVIDGAGNSVASQIVALDVRTLQLPLLYINAYGLTPAEIKKQQDALANKADHVLVFDASIPPVGFTSYSVKASAQPTAEVAKLRATNLQAGPLVVENDMWALSFNQDTGLLTTLTNKKAAITTELSINWGWYNSSVGGCTQKPDYVDPALWDDACAGQRSGAYMFRPNTSDFFYPGPKATPTINVVEGDLLTEVYQTFSSWATHVIRLYKGKPYVEVEWTAGPIPIDTPWFPPVAYENGKPMDNNWGKEVIVKYASGLKSAKTFYTDSNGKEMVKRVVDKRGPSYPQPFNISEPIAGNYYPVNALMSLDDGAVELAVIIDASQGGASLNDGELEFMVHRRIQADDSRGVEEPLNETMCGCNDINAQPGHMGQHGHEGDGGCLCQGLTVRGKHWIVLDKIDTAHRTRRVLSELINFPATLSFSQETVKVASFSAISAALPENVKLQALTSNYQSFHDGQWLLRLSHLYEAGEHSTLAQPVTVNLQQVFGKAGLTITDATETTLTANQLVADFEARKHRWTTFAANGAVEELLTEQKAKAFETKIPFTFPSVTIRPMEVRTFLARFK